MVFLNGCLIECHLPKIICSTYLRKLPFDRISDPYLVRATLPILLMEVMWTSMLKILSMGFYIFLFYHDVALLFKIPNLCKDKRPELVKPFIVCYLQGSYEYPCLKYIFSFGHDQANYGWAWIAQWACESRTGVSTRVQFWQDGQNKQTSGDLRIYITHVTRMYLPTKCNVSYYNL